LRVAYFPSWNLYTLGPWVAWVKDGIVGHRIGHNPEFPPRFIAFFIRDNFTTTSGGLPNSQKKDGAFFPPVLTDLDMAQESSWYYWRLMVGSKQSHIGY